MVKGPGGHVTVEALIALPLLIALTLWPVALAAVQMRQLLLLQTVHHYLSLMQLTGILTEADEYSLRVRLAEIGCREPEFSGDTTMAGRGQAPRTRGETVVLQIICQPGVGTPGEIWVKLMPTIAGSPWRVGGMVLSERL